MHYVDDTVDLRRLAVAAPDARRVDQHIDAPTDQLVATARSRATAAGSCGAGDGAAVGVVAVMS